MPFGTTVRFTKKNYDIARLWKDNITKSELKGLVIFEP